MKARMEREIEIERVIPIEMDLRAKIRLVL